MAISVAKINSLLKQFDTLNTAIVRGTVGGADITDYLDQRDNVLSQLSQEVGITVQSSARTT